MRLIDADVLKQHIDKLPALPDGNFAGNHSALKALINMQPTFEPSTSCSEFPNSSDDTISRQAAIDRINKQREHLEPDVYPQDKIGDAAYRICAEFIKRLPSAQRKGKWIYLNGLDAFECSVCGRQMVRNIFDYCPWCGAEMTKGEEDE